MIRRVANGEVCLEDKYLNPLFRSVDRSHPTRRPPAHRPRSHRAAVHPPGLTNREIAARVEVSEGAVKASLRQLFRPSSESAPVRNWSRSPWNSIGISCDLRQNASVPFSGFVVAANKYGFVLCILRLTPKEPL